MSIYIWVTSKTDMLDLFDIANSHGRVGEQSGAVIRCWLKFGQQLALSI